MTQDEAEKLTRTCLERIKHGAAVGLLDEDVMTLCNYILSGDIRREIENAAYRNAAKAVCNGTFYRDNSGEKAAEIIRSLIQPPAK